MAMRLGVCYGRVKGEKKRDGERSGFKVLSLESCWGGLFLFRAFRFSFATLVFNVFA